MTPIIIGAGRGRRLKHLTDDIPKPLVPIVGRPMLESILEALQAGGFSREQVVFICGYKGHAIQQAYPLLRYVENTDWQNNTQPDSDSASERRRSRVNFSHSRLID